MRLIGFAVSFEDGDAGRLGLREQVKRFHERKLEVLDARIQVLFAAEAARVLEQCNHRLAPLVLHQRVGINSRLGCLAVLCPLMDHDGTQT